ncbi:MAG: hypothetical protein ACTSRZ_11175 [Promethearchaeota archaeon]
MKNQTKLTGILFLIGIIGTIFAGTPGIFAAAGTDTTFQNYSGHSLYEPDFAFIYDVVGDQLVQDFTPGEYAANISDGLVDSKPNTDMNFYVAYTNMGQVQTIYIANQNITLDTANATKYGCAPYQLMINHFRAPGNLELFVINAFLGVLAYRENGTEKNGVPDANEQLYIGWTAFSELFKFLFNQGLQHSGIPSYNLYNPAQRAVGTPIMINKTIDGDKNVYTYGMSYQNIFVVWQRIDVEEQLNDTDHLDYVAITRHVAAVGLLKSLNFTFEVSGVNSTQGYTNVTIQTLYQIGELENLWVFGDNASVAASLGGYGYKYNTNIEQLDIALYNTSVAIENRLIGNSTLPGFGLAVANYMHVVILGTRPPASYIKDKLAGTLDPENQDANITRADVMLQVRRKAVKAFEMTHEGKDTYILDGNTSDPKQAYMKVVRNTKLRNPIATFLYWHARNYLINIYESVSSDFTIADRLKVVFNRGSMFYMTCFPEWNGKSIVNDPTFTVFAGAGTSLGFLLETWHIILIAGLVGAAIAIIVIQKKKRK